MDSTQAEVPIRPRYDLLNKVEAETGIRVSRCFQCRKCSNGCPLTFAMDLYPDRVVRYLLLGCEEQVLNCRTIWVCSSCETCTTRCPNDIDIAGLMDYLKEEAHRRGIVDPTVNFTYAFHSAFLEDIARRGRVHEGFLLGSYMLNSGAWKNKLQEGNIGEDMRLAVELVRRGRMPFKPKGIRDLEQVREFFEKGCAARSGGEA